jgi:hypothetical protein
VRAKATARGAQPGQTEVAKARAASSGDAQGGDPRVRPAARARAHDAPSELSAVLAVPRVQPETGAVLITGICGRIGRLLARRLHREQRVIGIDRRSFDGIPADVVHHQMDVRRRKTREVFRAGGIRAVVHLGIMHNPRESDRSHHEWNVVGFQKLLDYLTQYHVGKLVQVLARLVRAEHYPLEPGVVEILRLRIASAVIQVADIGCRDSAKLEQLVMERFWGKEGSRSLPN